MPLQAFIEIDRLFGIVKSSAIKLISKIFNGIFYGFPIKILLIAVKEGAKILQKVIILRVSGNISMRNEVQRQVQFLMFFSKLKTIRDPELNPPP